jgi:hypothetical protein
MGPRGAVAALTLVMLLSPISDALILRDSQLVHKVFPFPNGTNHR